MTRSIRSTRRRKSAPPAYRGGWVFLLIFFISLLLTFFVLFMQRRWKMSGQRNILIIHNGSDEVRKPLSLAVLRLPEKEITLISLPPEQSINVLSNESAYSSDALVGYTQLEEYDWAYLRYLIGLEYGVVLDGIVWSDVSPQELDLGVLRSLAQRSLWRRIPTSLAYWDRLQWWRKGLSIPEYQVEKVSDLSGFLNDSKALDIERYQRSYFTKIQDPSIRNSGWSVSILNGSGIQGYASRVASALESMGYEVRSVDTVDQTTESAIVFAPQRTETFQEEEWAEQRLKDFFSSFERREDEDMTRRRRSNAVIILGSDQTDLWR